MGSNFREIFFPKPRIYGVSRFLCFLVLLLLLISIGASKEYKEMFVWLMFCIPVLWIFWFICLFQISGDKSFYKLFFSWALINLIIFIFIFSFSDFEGWKSSRDGDVVITTIYFPVVMPLVLLLNVLPDVVGSSLSNSVNSLARFLGNSGSAYFLSIWIYLSGLSVIESLGLVGISRFFAHRKKAN